MIKRIVLILFSWLVVFANMLMISNFSLESGEESKETSGGVTEIIVPNYNEMSPSEKGEAEFSVRKIAHFSIYLLLGFTLANAFLKSINFPKGYYIIVSIFTSIIYALFDEYVYQALSDGRAPQMTYVIIDSVGATIGVCAYFLIVLVYSLIMKKRKKEVSN